MTMSSTWRWSKTFNPGCFSRYWVTPRGLRVAARTVAKMVEKVARLDEQGATASRIDRYLHHWGQWVRAGLGDRLMPGPVDEGCGLTYLVSMGDNHNVAAKWIRTDGNARCLFVFGHR